MVLYFIYWSTADSFCGPIAEATTITFSPQLICLHQAWGIMASFITQRIGTDVWSHASVQYHLIVLGLKYEISLQICPEETGMLCERRRQRTKLMWIRHSPAGGEGKKKPTLVSRDNDCSVCFCGSARPLWVLGRCSHWCVKTIYPPSSQNFPCNSISIPVPCLKLWDKLSGMTLVK